MSIHRPDRSRRDPGGRIFPLPDGRGRFEHAACCFLRSYQDGIVGRVPSADDVAELVREVPGIIFEPHVAPGTRLSDLAHQETYSYALALVYIGGDSPEELDARYALCRERLDFDIRPAD